MSADQRNTHYTKHGSMPFGDGVWYPSMERCAVKACQQEVAAVLARQLLVTPRGHRTRPLIAFIRDVLDR